MKVAIVNDSKIAAEVLDADADFYLTKADFQNEKTSAKPSSI